MYFLEINSPINDFAKIVRIYARVITKNTLCLKTIISKTKTVTPTFFLFKIITNSKTVKYQRNSDFYRQNLFLWNYLNHSFTHSFVHSFNLSVCQSVFSCFYLSIHLSVAKHPALFLSHICDLIKRKQTYKHQIRGISLT